MSEYGEMEIVPEVPVEDIKEELETKRGLLENIKRVLEDSKGVIKRCAVPVTVAGVLLLNACSPLQIQAGAVPIIDNTPTSTLSNPLPTEESSSPTSTPKTYETEIPTPIPTEIQEPTPTPEPEIDPEEFDYSMLNLMEWEGELKVENKEELGPGYVVKVRPGYKTMLYVTPLFDDYNEESGDWLRFKDTNTGMKMTEMSEGFTFEILETKEIVGEDGNMIKIGVVRNGSGSGPGWSVISLVLSAQTENGMINFVEEAEEDISVATRIDFSGDSHTIDIASEFLTLRNILQYQKENGPFRAGETYSLREVADMDSDEFQKMFFYPDGRGAGVDSVSTALGRFLIKTKSVARRTPYGISDWMNNVSAVTGIDATLRESSLYGTRFLKEDTGKPRNDLILTFKEGKNGEDAYWIDGQGWFEAQHSLLTFQLLTSDIDNIDQSIEEIDEIYQKILEFGEASHRVGDDDWNKITRYILASNEYMTDEMIDRVQEIINLICPPKNSDYYYK